MKIGAITFHCSYNFGSALQAYALQTYLTRQGNDVHIIDYRSSDFDAYKLFRMKGIRSFAVDLFSLPGNLKRRKSFHNFWGKYFNLTERMYAGPSAEEQLSADASAYDAIICGSDQIWNLDCTHGPVPPFFLSFAPDRALKISYAPSLAHPTFEKQFFTQQDKDNIAHWLNRFDSISVREIPVAGQFEALTDKPFTETVDPTLLLEADDYKTIQSEELPKNLKSGQYIFAYTLWPNDDMVQYIDDLAKKYNKTIVYYSKRRIRYTAKSINVWGVGPAEFLSLIAEADSVISNSFHATVFSILYNKPFLTFGMGKTSSRMRTLLNHLDFPAGHLLPDDFKGGNGIEPFASELDLGKLGKLREKSERFLSEALQPKM
ncbi:polysaccharide pyruvyl transferase family protein [Bifidobacterium animalis]|uniref:polysaccharide pyruvyl transferase family protein n=1 Tax=Bifidobacterium animalis TaxID=28025 RepID=UPI003F90022C